MKKEDIIIKKSRKKQSKVKKWFWNILFVICLGVFVYSAGNIIKDYYGSYKAGKDLSNLKESVFKSSNNADEKKTDKEKVVNLEELKKLNSDSIGWLEIPGTNIDEPLVQGKDNDYYLWRDFKKNKYPVTGTLFLDMYNKADFSDRISYIFGHNIWDKTKFYDLRKFEDKTFLENHKTFYVYTEKGKLEYEVLSVDLVDPDTPLYELSSKRNEDVDAMKKELSKHISKSEVDKIDKNTKLLMLVTCKMPDDNTARRILFAKLKEK